MGGIDLIEFENTENIKSRIFIAKTKRSKIEIERF